jgi:hypothetical protein
MAAFMVSSFGVFVTSFFADLFTVPSGQTLRILPARALDFRFFCFARSKS